MTRSKRIYVLDTNVLMHDPTALFKFEEHDVFLPMQVIEELDNAKKGMTEVSRNARQVSRFLNELIEGAGAEQIDAGIVLSHPQGLQLKSQSAIGKLYFQTKPVAPGRTFGTVAPDNKILAAVLELREQHPDVPVILVSKDINLRIKAAISGLVAEDYENDRALDDFSLLFTGATELSTDFWDRHEKDLRSWSDKAGRTSYEVAMTEDEDWYPNQFLYLPGDDEVEFRVAKIGADKKATLALADDFRSTQHAVWGITARNREQNFALNVLMDPDVDFVTLLGTAGTGKTLLA
ncbi:MAG: PhoH family protein, partial [Pseudoxanthomonas sp.]